MTRNLSSLALLLAACSLPGCAMESDPSRVNANSVANDSWRTPVKFCFTTLRKDDAVKVESVLQAEKLLYRRVNDAPLTYEVRGLQTGADVTRVSKLLSKSTETPVETAQVNFGPALNVANFAPVDVKVTPGAVAYIADGKDSTPWRRIYIDKGGEWKGMVYLKGTVAKQAGWLYIAATKDHATKYFRLNTGTKAAETLTAAKFKEAKLPEAGTAGSTQTAQGGEFEWPWE